MNAKCLPTAIIAHIFTTNPLKTFYDTANRGMDSDIIH